MAHPIIKLENVWKIYQMGKVKVIALRGLSLAIHKGEFVAIMGPSGSGKSTAVNMVGCLDVPSKGKVDIVLVSSYTVMKEIEAIHVYNPSQDGLDWQTYLKAVTALSEINPTALRVMQVGLADRVGNSIVDKGLTLNDYLGGEDGFWRRNPEIKTVVFADGKYHSHNNEYLLEADLERIAAETNSIPYQFSWSPDISSV